MSSRDRQSARLPASAGAAVSGSITEDPVTCVISDRYHFICLLIAKNASSTLRTEFRQEIFDSYERLYPAVDPQVRDGYFTFAPMREPVSRLLSAYQEISMRFQMEPHLYPQYKFFPMDDTPERFNAFLDTLGDSCWDPHVRPQVKYLAGVRVDLFACVERLQEGVEDMFRRLDIKDCPRLPVRRSRQERKDVHGYGRFILSSDDLDDTALSRIRHVYEADVQLYNELFPGA